MIEVKVNSDLDGLGKFFPEAVDKALREAAVTSLALMQTRIHEKGLGSDNAKLGEYSTKPIYVSAKDNPGKSFGRPIGKTGKSKFKSGKDHKSRYFKEGYKQFKKAIGRGTEVNFSLSGQLNLQTTVIKTTDGYGIGWPDDEKLERALALEDKFKKTWDLTDSERETANEVFKETFFKHLNN